MADVLFNLFDDFAVRYARGEQPDPVPYLERAAEHADELGRMLDTFLQWAPAPTPDEAAVTLMRAWLTRQPPLRELRVSLGLRVDEVVNALAAQLEVDVVHTGKLRRYFQRLERGALDVERVDHRVFEALASALRTSASILLGWASAPRGDRPLAAPAYRTEREPTVAPAVPVGDEEGWDEVDELFLGRDAGS